MAWKSYAQWPEGVCTGNTDRITTDSHPSQEHAQAVCDALLRDALLRDGLGGEGKVFPLRAWAAPVDSPAKESLR